MNTIAIYANTNKEQAIYWSSRALQFLRTQDVRCIISNTLAEFLSDDSTANVEKISVDEFEKFADVVVCFGGDGTMLSAAQKIIRGDIPLMGINVGKLGFLAEFSVTELEESLLSLINGDYRIVDRAILETTYKDETMYAFNEFVIEKYNSSKMITIRASVDGHLIADYSADGIILTTPTGSTAYSLSNGGPIIAPSAEVFCITPIAPHSLTLRPLIIPDSLEITLELISSGSNALLVADGLIQKELTTGERVSIKRSSFGVKLIKHKDTTYFELLRNKLLWSAGAGG
ncbi:MAG: NAD(+)/NADH kinase [Ignavibacteria bacterium]|nr:NAD(+)/NADH kinase [Ignavibacteria bacterium]